MQESLEAAKAAEREANPELAAQEEAAREIAAARKEAAERLPDEERNDLIARMSSVFATGDQDKVQALLNDYSERADAAKADLKKKSAPGSGASDDDVAAADTTLVLAKKRLLELQQAYKREVDLKAERVR